MSARIETGKHISEQQLWPYYDKIHHHADRITGGFIFGFFTLGLLPVGVS